LDDGTHNPPQINADERRKEPSPGGEPLQLPLSQQLNSPLIPARSRPRISSLFYVSRFKSLVSAILAPALGPRCVPCAAQLETGNLKLETVFPVRGKFNCTSLPALSGNKGKQA
jgi:hypothetical protein